MPKKLTTKQQYNQRKASNLPPTPRANKPIQPMLKLCDRCCQTIDHARQCQSGDHCWVRRHPDQAKGKRNAVRVHNPTGWRVTTKTRDKSEAKRGFVECEVAL